MNELLGYIALFFSCVYLLPQVRKTISLGHGQGLSSKFLYLYFGEKLFSLLYAISINKHPFILKYVVGLIFVSVLIWYKNKWRFR